jgi:hypothetical protein
MDRSAASGVDDRDGDREVRMRIKPDGTLGAAWWEPPAKTMEQLREELIVAVLRVYPTLSREEAEEHADAVL